MPVRRPRIPEVEFDGLILIDKAEGCTSRRIVDDVARKLGRNDVGHAGTLDPIATGLMLVLSGRGTKLVPFIHEWRKEYRATVTLGEATDTLDRTGRILTRGPVPENVGERLDLAVASMIGPVLQEPPMFSAVRVDGVRLHELARRGITTERRPRLKVIHELEVISCDPPRVDLRIICSSGTYVRVLAELLGRKLGTPAHLAELERTRIGPFHLDSAAGVDALDVEGRGPAAAWVRLENVLCDWPLWRVGTAGARDLAQGRIPASYRSELGPAAFPARVRAVGPDGTLVALVEWVSPDVAPVFLRGLAGSGPR